MMGEILGRSVSRPQNTFVRRRQMLDPVLGTNECFDSTLKSSDKGILCKLDMENAGDHHN